MLRSERSTYTPLDFRQWQQAGGLVLSPKFQRRGVWNRNQRSFLIDTLLLELPIPPLYIRIVQSDDNRSIKREVIDGQQRLGAILDYMEDKYSLSSKIETPFHGKRYSELPAEQKNIISRYPFICEVFYGLSDKDVLRIFSRLNTNSVRLNAQELRNGEFFGDFKRTCYDLAFEHLEFWRRNRIFSEQGIARMQEAELTSELIVAEIAGIQDKKKYIDAYYERFDEAFPAREQSEVRFRAVIDAINEAVPDGLGDTEFRRSPVFYSLFAAVFHRMFGLPRFELPTDSRGRLSRQELEGIHDAVATLSETLRMAKEDIPVPEARLSFVTACTRQTDNIRPRLIRVDTVYRTAFA